MTTSTTVNEVIISDDTKNSIVEEIITVKEPSKKILNEHFINIAFVGEFFSGKTTIISAFLQCIASKISATNQRTTWSINMYNETANINTSEQIGKVLTLFSKPSDNGSPIQKIPVNRINGFESLKNVHINLIDTPGLRYSVNGKFSSKDESIIQKIKNIENNIDILCVVIDVSKEFNSAIKESFNVFNVPHKLYILNKYDDTNEELNEIKDSYVKLLEEEHVVQLNGEIALVSRICLNHGVETLDKKYNNLIKTLNLPTSSSEKDLTICNDVLEKCGFTNLMSQLSGIIEDYMDDFVGRKIKSLSDRKATLTEFISIYNTIKNTAQEDKETSENLYDYIYQMLLPWIPELEKSDTDALLHPNKFIHIMDDDTNKQNETYFTIDEGVSIQTLLDILGDINDSDQTTLATIFKNDRIHDLFMDILNLVPWYNKELTWDLLKDKHFPTSFMNILLEHFIIQINHYLAGCDIVEDGAVVGKEYLPNDIVLKIFKYMINFLISVYGNKDKLSKEYLMNTRAMLKILIHRLASILILCEHEVLEDKNIHFYIHLKKLIHNDKKIISEHFDNLLTLKYVQLNCNIVENYEEHILRECLWINKKYMSKYTTLFIKLWEIIKAILNTSGEGVVKV